MPVLYNPGNLRFMTKEDGRLPTLYFVSGNTSGRLCQQHGSGPAVIQQDGKKDLFFTNEDDLLDFKDEVRADITADPADFNGATDPIAGAMHLEVTCGNNKVDKTHISGGLIDLDIGAYDLTAITKIYMEAIGRST